MTQKPVLFLASMILLFSACKKSIQDETSKILIRPSASAVDLNHYTLFGQDDFSGTALNTSIWDYRMLNGKRTSDGGLTYDSLEQSNVVVNNGVLVLIDNHAHDNIYGASMISTEQHPQYQLRYGYYEIKAQLPAFYGSAPAFWLQSGTEGVTNNNPHINGVEIDVFEYGKRAGNDSLFHSLHWNGYAPGVTKQISAHVRVPNIAVGYHTFALEWTPKQYTIYVDGVVTATSDSAVSHKPEFVILSSGTGGFGGNPMDPGNTFPDYFSVDYLKIYSRNPEVTLFDKADYYGWVSNGLQPGSYTKAQLTAAGVVDNATSSIEIPIGWRVVLYDGDNFTGDSVQVNADIPNITFFNDKVTSLRVYNP